MQCIPCIKRCHIAIIAIVLMSCQQDKTETVDHLIQLHSQALEQYEGRTFRDLNHNGKLDIYEDPSQPIDARVNDLLQQMTLDEKAGAMFMDGVGVSADGDPAGRVGVVGPGARRPPISELMTSRKLNNFNVWAIPPEPILFARWYNNVQKLAESNRLGIPVMIASDPRHHLGQNVIGASASGFTQFCETTGFGALDDEQLMLEFANIVRQEYMAIGIRMALHPQIDLATEPRWARISGIFSEDADLTARLVKPYIRGLQGRALSEGVACMTKHFPGGGPQNEGLDPHFEFQKGQVYPGDNFEYHLIPFEAAFEANTTSIMPYYGIPVDQTSENVAMAFNREIITGLLRDRYQFDGVICADWGLITDVAMGPDVVWKARAWGVEQLSEVERVERMLSVGIDQFGGESRPELVVELVQTGKLSEERIDESVRRILRQKFELGLFDNPFVDESKVESTMAKDEWLALGRKTQMESMTLLKNTNSVLPLDRASLNVYIEGVDSLVMSAYANVVESPEEADIAIIRLSTPWYPAETPNPFARTFHHGDLDFKGEEKTRILSLLSTVPTIVDIYLDRPAVIPEIAAASEALIADFGASDLSLCEVLFGESAPKGKLPFELPSSMDAVRNQKADVPYDSEDPLFQFGFGLSYQ